MEGKNGFSRQNVWALSEEEIAAAGGSAPVNEPGEKACAGQSPPAQQPKTKRRSTVRISPWDPMRDSAEETVDEWLEETSPEEEGAIFPSASAKERAGFFWWAVGGLLAGWAVGAIAGGQLYLSGGGLLLGLVLGIVLPRRGKG